MKLTEDVIIERILDGDSKAFSFLVNKHKDLVFTICLKLCKDRSDAEELAQISFIKAFESLSSFNAKASFSSWIYRIAYNTSLDYLKKKQRYQFTREEENHKIQSDEQTDERLINAEEKQILAAAIDKLDERQQMVILLYYYEEKKIQEISVIMTLSEANIKVILYRARKQLLNSLKGQLKREGYAK